MRSWQASPLLLLVALAATCDWCRAWHSNPAPARRSGCPAVRITSNNAHLSLSRRAGCCTRACSGGSRGSTALAAAGGEPDPGRFQPTADTIRNAAAAAASAAAAAAAADAAATPIPGLTAWEGTDQQQQIESPFAPGGAGAAAVGDGQLAEQQLQRPLPADLLRDGEEDSDDEEDWGDDGYGFVGTEPPLPLTLENVEMVLDELRPYLIADGGNVRVAAIDGAAVRLELQGACGSCPSSTMTMKMGLERRLRERIPEISEVLQNIPDVPPVSEEEVEKVLSGVRPFLATVGGSIEVAALEGTDKLQPRIALRMTGGGAGLQSVRGEITQRLRRHFPLPTLRIDWLY